MRLGSILFAIIAMLCMPFEARAEIQVRVSYSETVNFYSLMDNVSAWLDGYTNPIYRTEWQERFGWNAADQMWANRYAEYRRRTFPSGGQSSDPRQRPDGMFASANELAAEADPLLRFLASQPDVGTALRNLDRGVSPSDARMLRGFYAHFAPGWQVILRESQPLDDKARALQAQLNDAAVSQFLARVARFYRSEVGGTFNVYFTRRPPGQGSSAEVTGGQTILLHSPVDLPFERGEWDTIVMHEFVHFISAGQSLAQKRALTERFLTQCPVWPGPSPLWLLEEPLAVAWGQAAYSANVIGRPLDPNTNWYGIPYVNIVSRTLAPSIIAAYANDDTIDHIIDQAAARCADMAAMTRDSSPPSQ